MLKARAIVECRVRLNLLGQGDPTDLALLSKVNFTQFTHVQFKSVINPS